MRSRKSTKRSGSSASRTGQQAKSKKPSTQSKPARTRKRTTKKRQAAQRSRTTSKRQRQSARQRRHRQSMQRRRGADRPHELTGQGLQNYTVGLLKKFLKLPDHSPHCSATLLLTVLLAAAGECTSIAATCYRLQGAPSEQTIYNALGDTLCDYTQLERRVNRALQAQLPANLRRRRQRLAIDLTLIPYHGEPEKLAQEIYRSQAKQGTSHFHAYASLYLVVKGERFTVALIWVQQGQALKKVVQRLLHLGAQAGIHAKLLLLDRGFYTVEVIGYLKRARVPFLMPAVARGRKPAAGQPAKGIRAFQIRKRGGWGTHTLSNGKRREKVKVCVYCGNYRGQWKRHGRYAWVYVYWGCRPGSPRWVADTYRQRFGIETSYRQMNQGRIKTCMRSPLKRYLYVAIALILRNVWVWLHWEVLSSPRRGRRRVNLERMTLEGLLVYLWHAAVAILGLRSGIVTERPVPSTLAAGTG